MSFRAPKTESVSIDGPVGRLEAVYEAPGDEEVETVAVLCHPHPLYHGTMNNKVVHTLARSFHRLGVPTVRFNFRGVGQSEGKYGESIGETEDALAVVEWLRERHTTRSLWLGGFSFGALVALRAAATAEPVRLITVAPPVRRFDVADVSLPDCPWLIIQGGADEVVDADDTIEWINELPPGPEFVLKPDVDHFFHGRLTQLRETVMNWLQT